MLGTCSLDSCPAGRRGFAGVAGDKIFLRSLALPGHGVRCSTASFRALVAESSHSELKLFRGHFLDAAPARSMTGGMAWQGCFAWRRGFHFVIPRVVAESSHSGLKLFRGRFLDAATARSMTGGAV